MPGIQKQARRYGAWPVFTTPAICWLESLLNSDGRRIGAELTVARTGRSAIADQIRSLVIWYAGEIHPLHERSGQVCPAVRLGPVLHLDGREQEMLLGCIQRQRDRLHVLASTCASWRQRHRREVGGRGVVESARIEANDPI